MITVTSGLPGAGKTLYTIWYVRKYVEQEYRDAIALAEKKGTDISLVEKRTVYYRGIRDLTLSWNELTDDECKLWYELPIGSIIVIDEAQKIFTSMGNSANRPKYYTEVDEHRHRGYDLFLITQDPVNIDQRPRSMAERHFHLSRSFGLGASTLYEFQGVQYITGGKYKRIEGGQKEQWKFPKEVFGYYKSAEVHTHKSRLPYKKLILIIIPLAIFGPMIVYGYMQFNERSTAKKNKTQLENDPGSIQNTGLRVQGVIPENLKRPLVPGDVLTTPMYSQLIQVKAYPRIDGCALIKIGSLESCSCNDQRGNKISIPYNVCSDYITNGYFDYSITDDHWSKIYDDDSPNNEGNFSNGSENRNNLDGRQ